MKKDNLKRDINLFEAIFKDKTKKTRDMEKDIKNCVKLYVAILLLVLVGFGGYVGVMAISTSTLQKETAELATESTKEEIRKHKEEMEFLEKQNNDIDAKIKEFDESVKLLKSDLEEIAKEQPEDQTFAITALSYEEGEFTITCQYKTDIMGSIFAQQLADTGRYSKVEAESTTVDKKTGLCTADIVLTFKNSAKEGKEGNK